MISTSRYVVIGNGAAGNSAAERLRQNDPDAAITLIAAERHPHYSRVALPRYVRGQIGEDKVLMRKFDDYTRLGIELRSGISARAVDARDKTVTCSDGSVHAFDKLLIATGGRPKQSGWELSGQARTSLVFQTLEDARRIIEFSDQSSHVLVIGGGYIGYELAECIAHRNRAKVTWIMRGPRFLHQILDEQAGAICDALAEAAGVSVVKNDSIAGVSPVGARYRVTTVQGRVFEVDLIAQGIGIDYFTEPAESAGIAVDRGIATDSRLRTEIKDIFAAGDIARFVDEKSGRQFQVGAWDSAVSQGRLAADNMSGGDKPFEDVTTYTTSLFGSTLAVIGDLVARPEKRYHTVYDGEKNYRLFHFVGDTLAGAVVIGSPKGRKRLIELVRDKISLGSRPETLPEFATV